MEEDRNKEIAIRKPVTHRVSNFRIVASQYCAIGALCILLFTNGSSFGLIVVLLGELGEENSEIKTNFEDLSWIGSLNYLLIPLGNLASGLTADRIGRQKTLILLTIPYLIAWTAYGCARSVGVLLASIALTGAAGGLLEGTAITFTAEISQARIRSVLSAGALTASNFGMFLQILLGRFVYWRTLVVINVVLTFIYAAAMFWVPESPHWLASKGHHEKAEKSLAWFRGWTTPIEVRAEFGELCDIFETTSSSSTAMINDIENIDDYAKRRNWKNTLRPYLRRSFCVPFLLVSFAFFLAAFNGSNSVLTYSVITFGKIQSPIDKYNVTIIAGLFNLIGTFTFVLIISRTGKRKLLFLTMTASGLAYFVSSVILSLSMHSSIFVWIPTIMILLSAFFAAVGINMIPYILAGEVFPVNLTNVGTGSAVALYNVLSWLNNKTYLHVIDSITLPGTFLFFTMVNIVGCITLYWVLPETEGKTKKEIQKYFSKTS